MRLMKSVLVNLCLSLLCFNAFAQEEDAATAVFEQLKVKLDKIDDYVADVRVDIDVSFMKVPPLAGKLYFKAPDKMKLERKGGISILPKKNMSFTLNSMFPEGNVTVIDAGTDMLNGEHVRVIKVIPDNDASGIILTKVWIDPVKILALRTETTTRENGTVKMNLEFGKYAQYALPDKVTVYLDVKEFKIPKGVTMDYDAGQTAMGRKDTGKSTPKKGEITINYLKYDVNAGVSDAIFTEND